MTTPLEILISTSLMMTDTRQDILKFQESMTFSDAEGYSIQDTDRIVKHLRHCQKCHERCDDAVRNYFKEKELIRLGFKTAAQMMLDGIDNQRRF